MSDNRELATDFGIKSFQGVEVYNLTQFQSATCFHQANIEGFVKG